MSGNQQAWTRGLTRQARRIEGNVRLYQVLVLREQGMTFKAIGSTLGVTKGRAHQMFKKASAGRFNRETL